MKIGKNNISDFNSDIVIDNSYYLCYICSKNAYMEIKKNIEIIPVYSYEPHNDSAQEYWFLITKTNTIKNKHILKQYQSRPYDLTFNIDLGLAKNPSSYATLSDILKKLKIEGIEHDEYHKHLFLHRHTLMVDPWR